METDQAGYVRELKERLLSRSGNNTHKSYGYVQRLMAWHSDRIEGNILSPAQVTSVFDARAAMSGEDAFPVRTKHVEETLGHFDMFDRMLADLDEPLSEQIVKDLHRAFASPIFEYRANGYAAGSYKTRANRTGGVPTSLPEDVPEDMRRLLDRYGSLAAPDLPSVVLFHCRFERIHPFQDGNGRVGRMLLFRECLRNGIPPVIIHSGNRTGYLRRLAESQTADAPTDGMIRYMEEEQRASTKEILPMLHG